MTENMEEDYDITVDLEKLSFRIDLPSLIRISSKDALKGGVSALRAHAFPIGYTMDLAPGSYIVNTTCKIDPISVALPAVVHFLDVGRLDELGIAWEVATNGRMYLITVPMPLNKGGVGFVNDTDDFITTPLQLVAGLSTPCDAPGVKMLKSIN